jgi:peptidoglycan/xylan/chitin deacetylase (PgdA/CDA1 family)
MHDGIAPAGPPVVWRLPGTPAQCYLTFDDGPDGEWTPRFLDALAFADCRATFFVVGILAKRQGPLLRAARAAGHSVGNHGYSHGHPWSFNHERALRDVCDGADAIAQETGERPVWFRPAHGRLSRAIVEGARLNGQRIALWSVSAVDWGPFATPRRILARLSALRAGDIALLHDGPMHRNQPSVTVQALPQLLRRLAQEKLDPVPLPSPLQ